MVIGRDLVGYQLGSIKYMIDDMINNYIPAGTSFSDKEFDTRKFVGFMFHNEAIAMPIDIQSITSLINPDNANVRYLAKYQFGFGILRPELIRALVTELVPASKK